MKKLIVLCTFFCMFFYIFSEDISFFNQKRIFVVQANQYDEKVLDSFPQKILSVKKKKDYSIIKIKTTGCINKIDDFKFDTEKNADKTFLEITELIDFDSENIRILSERLDLSDINEIAAAKTALLFIRSAIKYDSHLANEISQGKSIGKSASETLDLGKGTCGECSNLFIALMRLNGIPCKFVSGVYYSGKQTMLHAWAEFYDSEKGWIPVDVQSGTLGISCFHIKLLEGLDFVDSGADFSKILFKIKSEKAIK